MTTLNLGDDHHVTACDRHAGIWASGADTHQRGDFMTTCLSRNTKALNSSAAPCDRGWKESFSQVSLYMEEENVLRISWNSETKLFVKRSVYSAKLADVWLSIFLEKDALETGDNWPSEDVSELIFPKKGKKYENQLTIILRSQHLHLGIYEYEVCVATQSATLQSPHWKSQQSPH